MRSRVTQPIDLAGALRHPMTATLAVAAALVALWWLANEVLPRNGFRSGDKRHLPGTTHLRNEVELSVTLPPLEFLREALDLRLPRILGDLPGRLRSVLAQSSRRTLRPAAAGLARATAAAPVRPPATPARAEAVQAIPSAPPIQEFFPTPAELAPAVEFWERVYREFTRDQYAIHDRDTHVVFAVLDLSRIPDVRRQRDRILEVERRQYASRIRRLSQRLSEGTTPEQLDAEERRWLAALMQLSERDPLSGASERLRVQRGQRDQFEAGLRRAGRFLPAIKAILRRHDLPEDLCLLPHVESSFNDQAVSRAGASGIWQLMPATGRLYLQVGANIDERNDPLLASEAAAKLLAKNFRHLGTWPLALTAYNHGLAGMLRAVREVGENDLVAIIQRHRSKSFGFASKNFYSEFLAARHVAKNASVWFPGVVPDPPLEHSELTLGAPKSLPSLASALKLETSELESLNPALMRPIRSGRRLVPAGYRLKIPVRLAGDALAALGMSGSAATVLSETTKSTAEPSNSEPDLAPLIHTVQAGDTLGALAKRYGTTVRQIVAHNALASAHRLRIGQRLRIPT
jgi:membrane-bound lytic murein transglycosylase D